MTKMRRSLWFWIIALLLVNGTILYCSACLEEERIGLLQIKSKFKAYPDPFPSWMDDDKKSDCCKWEGVKCNNITMQVIELSVNGTWSSTYPYFNASMFLPFKNLMALYLPENYLEGWFKNEGFDKLSQLRNLEVLDLSFNMFNRSVLSSLSQLSSLKVLKLSSNSLDSSTNKPSSERLSGLNNLEVLDLGRTLTNQSDILSILNLNDFISLKHLDISSNGLHTFGSSKNGCNMTAGLRNLEFLGLGLNLFNNNIFSSLKELPSLKYLDLSDNKLKGTIFAQELDDLSNLEELDLSRNEINDFQTLKGNKSTSHIRALELNYMKSNVSNLLPSLQVFPDLKSLYFEKNDLTGNIFTPTALGNLSNLDEIFLDYTSLNGNFLQSIGLVTSLKVLSMSYCGLNGTLSQIDWRSLENLQELALRGNQFHGSLPSSLANLTSLRLIDISSNRFTGNIAFSSLSKLTSLESLFISKNGFEVPISFEAFANHSNLVRIRADENVGVQETESRAWVPKFQLEEFTLSKCTQFQMLPRFLYYQKELRSLDVSRNHFRGRLPNWLFENNTQLEGFHMSGNDFIGSFNNMPSHAQPNIKFIEVSQNRLSGKLHMNISSVFSNLEILKMSGSSLNGGIPSSTWGMKRLRALDLSNNQFSGEVPTELAIPPLLELLHLNRNKLIGKIPKTLFSVKLVVLEISQNNFSGMIPPWMGQMSGLSTLAMSHNQLQGPIPLELCNLSILQFLDLAENQLSGSFPSCFNHLGSLEHLFLNANLLSGNLTHAFLDNSELLTLDLSNNKFAGSIPQWIDNLSALNILLLKNNQFEGEIPNHLCHLQRLRMTDLSHNKLTGSIPRCLGMVSSNFPNLTEWRDPPGHQIQMKVEFTTKNSSRYYEGSLLRYMSGIDLSSNELSGDIPIELGNLSVIQVLNLSHNSLMGGIPKTFSNLHAIGCIDLSYNNLSGRIPHELLELHALAAFSVAHNNLSGAIPELKGQFSTFDENSYEGNPFLCGPPLHINCSSTQLEPSKNTNEEEESGFIDMEIFLISFSVACPIFFLGVIITLCVNHYWRDRWFCFVENLIFSCCYFLVDRFR